MAINDVQRGYDEHMREGINGTLYSTVATTIDTYLNATVDSSSEPATLDFGVFVQSKVNPSTDTNEWTTQYCQLGVSRTGTGNTAANAVPDDYLGTTLQSRDRVTQTIDFNSSNDNYRFGAEIPVVSRGEIRMKVKQFATTTDNAIVVGGKGLLR